MAHHSMRAHLFCGSRERREIGGDRRAARSAACKTRADVRRSERAHKIGSAPVRILKISTYFAMVCCTTSAGSSSGVFLSKLIDLR